MRRVLFKVFFSLPHYHSLLRDFVVSSTRLDDLLLIWENRMGAYIYCIICYSACFCILYGIYSFEFPRININLNEFLTKLRNECDDSAFVE